MNTDQTLNVLDKNITEEMNNLTNSFQYVNMALHRLHYCSDAQYFKNFLDSIRNLEVLACDIYSMLNLKETLALEAAEAEVYGKEETPRTDNAGTLTAREVLEK